jgi:hypothetical protein
MTYDWSAIKHIRKNLKWESYRVQAENDDQLLITNIYFNLTTKNYHTLHKSKNNTKYCMMCCLTVQQLLLKVNTFLSVPILTTDLYVQYLHIHFNKKKHVFWVKSTNGGEFTGGATLSTQKTSNTSTLLIRSKSLWRWYISTNIMLLDIIHWRQGLALSTGPNWVGFT